MSSVRRLAGILAAGPQKAPGHTRLFTDLFGHKLPPFQALWKPITRRPWSRNPNLDRLLARTADCAQRVSSNPLARRGLFAENSPFLPCGPPSARRGPATGGGANPPQGARHFNRLRWARGSSGFDGTMPRPDGLARVRDY